MGGARECRLRGRIFTADSFELSGDVRSLPSAGKKKSWVDGGFRQTRSGSDGNFRHPAAARQRQPRLEPQFNWSFGAIVVGVAPRRSAHRRGLTRPINLPADAVEK